MLSYFKPLRRKFGVATLVIACVGIYPWLRSLCYFDAIHIPLAQLTSVCIMSVAGSVTVNIDLHQEGDNEASEQHYDLSDRFRFEAPVNDWFDAFSAFGSFMKRFKLIWRWCGFGIGMCLEDGRTHPLVAIPYWSIVIPLALLSAWLLFSNPRIKPKSEPPQI